jgi:hypothetical protein
MIVSRRCLVAGSSCFVARAERDRVDERWVRGTRRVLSLERATSNAATV